MNANQIGGLLLAALAIIGPLCIYAWWPTIHGDD